MRRLFCLILVLITAPAFSQNFTHQQYNEDFDYFWKTINDNYAYFEKKGIHWNSLRPAYQQRVDTISTRSSFVAILEMTMNELYDHHCSLGTNTNHSRRLVPTGADVWAAYNNGKPEIIEVRKGMGAEKAGIKAGMEVIAVDDVKVSEAIQPFLAQVINKESKSYALRLLLAGDHVTARKITLKTAAGIKDFFPDKEGMLTEHIIYPAMVESSMYKSIGYIKVNNFLYDNALIPKFDSVLNAMMQTRALIIDLRETASGGNTSIARAILGRFIAKEHFYQKHEYYAEEKETGIKRSWTEIVSPRGKTYSKPVVILGDHWTGSIAEGITIAFDGMKRATVIGTQLARLNGAVYSFRMPNTGIGFNITAERLFHVNGTPREDFNPAITVDVRRQSTGNDPILKTALHYLQQRIQ
nr:S41 family peptidase [uncultured Mucilaginibacter sp.]